MKKIFSPVVLVVFVLFCAGSLLAQGEDGKFQKTLEKYLEEYWKFFPTTATMAGFHKFDNELENFSEKNLEKWMDTLDSFNQEFVAKIDKSKLSPNVQIDHEIIVNGMDLERLKIESLVPWDYNPLIYNNILKNCIKSLFDGDFAPLETRAKNALERLKDLPGFLKEAKKSLKTPPQIYTQKAIDNFPAILDFYKTDIPALIGSAPADLAPKLQEESAKVVAALEDYQNYLQNELLAKSTGNPFLGQEAHTKLLRHTLLNDIPIQELINRSKADYNNIRREMALVCLPFFRIMYPNINIEQMASQRSEQENQNIVIKGVFDKIKENNVSKESYIESLKQTSEEIKNYITKNQLLDLPGESLEIAPMPPLMQGCDWTRLVTPGMYEQDGGYTLMIHPIPDTWSEEQVQSFFEEYTPFLTYFWTIRYIFPGTFMPFTVTRSKSSLVQKMYPNETLMAAWPVYVEEMFILSGFGKFDLRLRLNQLKLLLRAVIDFQMELNIHQSGMDKERVVNYMVRSGFQSQLEAEKKYESILLNPGKAALAYVGYQEILDMEKRAKSSLGDSFNQKEFLNKLLSFGMIPIRNLKQNF
ncbi:MAG: DUF885 family protein [Candidatus Aminicenantes bacterium]|nr:DUF885 family protein [Candidatus Aminicenantes bacterium]